MRKYGRFLSACLCALLCVWPISACQSPENSGRLRFAYISKDLGHYWFQQVSNGIADKCTELGADYTAFDAQYDDGKCMEYVKIVVEEKYSGLMICPTDQGMGPEIAELCSKAGVALITIDDPIKDAEGNSIPHVGMAVKEVGVIGGMALAKLAEERGFFEPGGTVRIVEIDVPGVSVFRERLGGYEDALINGARLSRKDIVVVEAPTGMYESNLTAFKQFLAGYDYEPDDKWIICGANDDCALAPMHALSEAGVPEGNAVACGLGGYELSIIEFQKGNANYITTMTQPDTEGARAVSMLYEYCSYGTPMENKVLIGGRIATCDNYLIYFNYDKLGE